MAAGSLNRFPAENDFSRSLIDLLPDISTIEIISGAVVGGQRGMFPARMGIRTMNLVLAERVIFLETGVPSSQANFFENVQNHL